MEKLIGAMFLMEVCIAIAFPTFNTIANAIMVGGIFCIAKLVKNKKEI